MSKEFTRGKESKDKNGGTFNTYSNGEQKIVEYTSKSGETAIFLDGRKVNKKKLLCRFYF